MAFSQMTYLYTSSIQMPHCNYCDLFSCQACLTSASLCRSCPGCFLANIRITSGVLKASLMAAWMASCIWLSSFTKVMFPPFILTRDSLNSFSCSRVSLLVSSYSSASRSALEGGTEVSPTTLKVSSQIPTCIPPGQPTVP